MNELLSMFVDAGNVIAKLTCTKSSVPASTSSGMIGFVAGRVEGRSAFWLGEYTELTVYINRPIVSITTIVEKIRQNLAIVKFQEVLTASQ